MRMKGMLYVAAPCIAFGAAMSIGCGGTRPGVVDAAYDGFSVTPPTPRVIFVCHGFGCKYSAELDLTSSDHAKLAQLMTTGKASAIAEREAVGAAGAWFDRRIGAVAGTVNHVARAGVKYMYDAKQFDCIDSSRNTTSLLLVLNQLNLLHYHDVDLPEARGYVIDGRVPHATAVLVEKANGTKWSIDSWTVGYGRPLEIMPLERWKTLGGNDSSPFARSAPTR